MKTAKIISLTVILILLIGTGAVFLRETKKQDKVPAQEANMDVADLEASLDTALRYYQNASSSDFNVDDYYLLTEIARLDRRFAVFPERFYQPDFREKPFYRLVDRQAGLTPDEEYWRDTGEYNLSRALYCDRVGYSDEDFGKLQQMYRGDGAYLDTHLLLSLTLLEKNSCYNQDAVARLKAKVVAAIVAAENRESIFSDIYAERLLFLCWAGAGDKTAGAWIKTLVSAQTSDGGWAYTGSKTSNPHTTGLVLLSILCYLDYDVEDFY